MYEYARNGRRNDTDMAQAITNAAIEAELHTKITAEAKENKISFSEQVSRYRALAMMKIREDANTRARLSRSNARRAQETKQKMDAKAVYKKIRDTVLAECREAK